MSGNRSVNRHPLTSLSLLVLFFLACYIVFTFISLFLASYVYGKDLLSIASGEAGTGVLRLIQGVTSAGAFIAPPLILAAAERKYKLGYLRSDKPFSIALIGLTIIIMFVSAPFLEWVIKLNQEMHLPGFLKGMEDWMRNKENLLDQLTKQLLVMHSVSDLLVNLLIIALIPAIGEEFIFRGCIQNIFTRLTSNSHWGIWIAAIIFSAIHVQFFGFFPRMLLGVLFGYLFVWSRSIWIPATAHFINNGTAVITAYVYQKQGKPLDELDKAQGGSVLIVSVSIIITVLFLILFYTVSVRNGLSNEKRQHY